MKVTITGATGFVGTNLGTYLKDKGHNINVLSLRGDWKSHLDGSAAAIIHLAGKAHDTSNSSSPDSYFSINKDLTIALFDEFLKTDISDFFYFSSVKAVVDTLQDILLESEVPNPLTPYGKSKYEAEQYLLSKELPKGKRLFIIRPCMIHGAGNKGNLNLLYKVVEKGIPWPLASFGNERSFLGIDNLSYLIEAMLDNKDIATGVYNFADDEPISTNSLVSLIAGSLNKNTSLLYVPKRFIEICAKLGDLLPLPLNSERLKKLTESYVISNQKIKLALGITSLPLTVEEGLEKTIRSFKL